jgi:GNAT superfamily N-acetyltransferase
LNGLYHFGARVVQTRVADPSDAATLAATVAEGFDGYRVWAPTGWSPPQERGGSTSRLAEALARADVWCLVAESRGDPVGHVALSPTTYVQPEPAPPGMVNLWQLFVRPAWQGTGLAAVLLRAALTEAERRGFARVRLWTPSGAVRARRFYEREGWALTGDRRGESPLGLPIVEYARDVPQRRQ